MLGEANDRPSERIIDLSSTAGWNGEGTSLGTKHHTLTEGELSVISMRRGYRDGIDLGKQGRYAHQTDDSAQNYRCKLKRSASKGGLVKNQKNHLVCVFALLLHASALYAETTRPAIRMGAVFALSGYAALAGQDELDGVVMAVDDINEQNRFAGKRIELATEDNRSDRGATVSAVQKLIGIDDVNAIIGPNWIEFTEVAAPIAQTNKIPLVTPSGWSENLTKGREFVFSGLENHPSIVKPLVDLIVKERPQRVTAFVATNQYFESIFDSISKQLETHSIHLTTIVRVNPDQTEFRPLLLQYKAQSGDLILNLLAEGIGLSSFYKQIRELRISSPVYSANSISYDEGMLSNLRVAEGTIFFDYIDPSSDDFKRRFEGRFKRKPLPSAARAYDAMKAVGEAALKCGTSPDQIARCLTHVTFAGASGPFGFDGDRNFKVVASPSRLYQIRNGKIATFE